MWGWWYEEHKHDGVAVRHGGYARRSARRVLGHTSVPMMRCQFSSACRGQPPAATLSCTRSMAAVASTSAACAFRKSVIVAHSGCRSRTGREGTRVTQGNGVCSRAGGKLAPTPVPGSSDCGIRRNCVASCSAARRFRRQRFNTSRSWTRSQRCQVVGKASANDSFTCPTRYRGCGGERV